MAVNVCIKVTSVFVEIAVIHLMICYVKISIAAYSLKKTVPSKYLGQDHTIYLARMGQQNILMKSAIVSVLNHKVKTINSS